MRRVFIDPVWKLHVGYHVSELLRYPPDGYQYLARFSNEFEALHRVANTPVRMASYSVALELLKSYFDWTKSRPDDIDLVFCYMKLWTRDNPWVVELDKPWGLVGTGNGIYSQICSTLTERLLSSENCKSILLFSEFAKNLWLSRKGLRKIGSKMEVLSRAVRPKTYSRTYSGGEQIVLLFVGSANLGGQFRLRGGLEAVAAFKRLSSIYGRAIKLIIRSDMPEYLKSQYSGIRNLEVVSTTLTNAEMDQLYKDADIFVYPSYYDTWLVLLEAMSYGLPVVTTGVGSSPELIENGKTGFLVEPSENWAALPFTEFAKPRDVDQFVTRQLVAVLSDLINDVGLRRRIGSNAKTEVEDGKFSIRRRNQQLKRIFDNALS